MLLTLGVPTSISGGLRLHTYHHHHTRELALSLTAPCSWVAERRLCRRNLKHLVTFQTEIPFLLLLMLLQANLPPSIPTCSPACCFTATFMLKFNISALEFKYLTATRVNNWSGKLAGKNFSYMSRGRLKGMSCSSNILMDNLKYQKHVVCWLLCIALMDF